MRLERRGERRMGMILRGRVWMKGEGGKRMRWREEERK